MLIFADADDVGIGRLVRQLSTTLAVTWWRFGISEDLVSVHADPSDFVLEQPGATVSSEDFRRADVIVYRRRLLQPRPLVTSGLSDADEQDFSEREWTSLIDGLLLAEEPRRRSTWINAPSATASTNNKLSLLIRAARGGLPVVPFSVSTPVTFPEPHQSRVVTKAISADERVGASRHFATALITPDDVHGLLGQKLPTPCLLQHYIEPRMELRVFYLLGRFVTLALTPCREHVDIRRASAEELSPEPYDLPPELQARLAEFTRKLDLAYCCFDLIVAHDGVPQLIDVTPNGGWDHFESAEAPLVSEALAATIASHIARM